MKMTRSRRGLRSLSTIITLAAGTVAAVPGAAQQAGFGTELFKRQAWTVRLDASANEEGTSIEEAGRRISVASEAAALVWRPRDRSEGNFAVRATVRMSSGEPGGAGVFFGGYDLEGMDRNWAACMVRPDGAWSIPHRNGVELHDFRPWSSDDAVGAAIGDEASVNMVEWIVSSSRVVCRINGVEMYGFDRARGIVPGGLRTIEGEVGIRVDAGVEAVFESFEVAPVALGEDGSARGWAGRTM